MVLYCLCLLLHLSSKICGQSFPAPQWCPEALLVDRETETQNPKESEIIERPILLTTRKGLGGSEYAVVILAFLPERLLSWSWLMSLRWFKCSMPADENWGKGKLILHANDRKALEDNSSERSWERKSCLPWSPGESERTTAFYLAIWKELICGTFCV